MRLMPESEHAEIDAETAESGGQKKEQAFGNPFGAGTIGFNLVVQHDQKSDQVNQTESDQNIN